MFMLHDLPVGGLLGEQLSSGTFHDGLHGAEAGAHSRGEIEILSLRASKRRHKDRKAHMKYETMTPSTAPRDEAVLSRDFCPSNLEKWRVVGFLEGFFQTEAKQDLRFGVPQNEVLLIWKTQTRVRACTFARARTTAAAGKAQRCAHVVSAKCKLAALAVTSAPTYRQTSASSSSLRAIPG